MTGGGDPWLDRWLGLLAERAGTAPILELGCGGGRDTDVLVRAGLQVIAIDNRAEALEDARRRAPSATFHCQDIRAPLPIDAPVGAIVASLSLHYFAWPETVAIVARIRAALTRRGVLLCRLNSTGDTHFGASGHPQIEPNYYLVSGRAKRFFDRDAIARLFASGWSLRHCEAHVVHRYDKPKALWEIVAEPCAAC